MSRRVLLAVVVSGLLAGAASAHLPAYEGERVRNDNHFTREGFAWPVRGECDFTAVGPTDPKAGSANIYLGPPNQPPNFFCGFTTQDDWSFEYPVDIIESSRTPAPDPRDLGQELEEGYIPCNPLGSPFQCPRQITNPQNPSEPIRLPGVCVDTGQPGDPAAADGPDGEYHCALLPGSPRPRTSAVHFSTLTGPDDVDWAIYRYDPVYAEVPIVGAPQVPACTETIGSFVSFAYAGPLGLKDARTGHPLFEPLRKARRLPREIRKKLPKGYGIRVSRPSRYRPSQKEPRLGYASGFAQNGWLLAEDSVVECIDSFEKCLADETGELSKHYNYNDIFFVDEDEPVDLYLMWWVDDRHRGGHWRWKRDDDDDDDDDGDRRRVGRRSLTDVSITTGVIDQFLVGDFINIGITGPFSGNGRYIHGACNDPRDTGVVDITIETN
ncbi:MAG: hypothetical protein QNK04_33830 [Myxococcota bacterium]|nr:hypothetical protein [Myxococcota bacterium]